MAAGDFVVRRNNANTDALPDTDGGTLDLIWDTSVDSEGSGITGGDSGASGVFTLGETGRFLVMASDQWGTTDTTANERTTSDMGIVLAGTLLREGADSEYVRRSGGSQEGICSGICYVNVATTTGNGDELIVRHTRYDNSIAGTVNRIADRSGVSIIKLDDDWNYAHYHSSSAWTPSATDNTRNQAPLGTTVEQDGTVFSRSGNVVTVTTSNPILVMWTHQRDYTDADTGRTEMQGSIDFDGAEVAVRGWNQVYGPRGTDEADAGAMSGATILYPNGGGQALELNLISREDADEDWFSVLQVIELPSGVETATVERTTAAGNANAAGTDFAWQAEVSLDTDAFTYSAGNANIDVDNAGDYIALANLGTVTDAGWNSGAQRDVPAINFRVNTTDQNHIGASTYNRMSGSAEHGHMFTAGLLPGLSASDSVQVRANRIGTATGSRTAVGGFSLIRLSSLFAGAVDATATPAAQSVGVTLDAVTATASADDTATPDAQAVPTTLPLAGAHRFPATTKWAELDGTDDNYSTADTAANSGLTDFTIEFAVKLPDTTPAANKGILAKWAASNQEFLIRLDTGGNWDIFLSDDGSSNTVSETYTQSLSTTEWNYLRITYDESVPEVEWFTSTDDGATWSLASNDPAVGLSGNAMFDGGASIEVGGVGSATGTDWDGEIAWMRMWDNPTASGLPVWEFFAEDHPSTGSAPFTSHHTGETWTAADNATIAEAAGDATATPGAFAVNTTHNGATVTAGADVVATAQTVTTTFDGVTVTASAEVVATAQLVTTTFDATTQTASAFAFPAELVVTVTFDPVTATGQANATTIPAAFEVLVSHQNVSIAISGARAPPALLVATTHNTPTVTASAFTSPGALLVLVTHNGPTLTTSAFASPTAQVVTTTFDSVTLTASAFTSPSVLPVTTTFDATTVTASAFATTTAQLVQVTFDAVNAYGGVAALPDPLIVTVTLDAPTLGAGSTTFPAAFTVPITFDAATPTASSLIVPAPLLVTTTFDATTVTASAFTSPVALLVTTTFDSVTVTASAFATPDAFLVPITFDPVTATGGTAATATPAELVVTTTLEAMTVTAGADPTLTAQLVTVTFDPVTATGTASATSTPAALLVTVTLPAVTAINVTPATAALTAQLVTVTFDEVLLPGGEVTVFLNPHRVNVFHPLVNGAGPGVGVYVAAHIRFNRRNLRKLRRQGVWTEPADEVGV